VTGSRRRGRAPAGPREVILTLPYGTLLPAAVLVELLVGMGLLLLLVPGIIAMTLLAIVGPVINIERRGLIASLRRSVELVRPHFWQAFLCVTVLVFIEDAVSQVIESLFFDQTAWLQVAAAEALLAASFGALVGLVEVALAYALLDHDAASAWRAGGLQARAEGQAGALSE
jgi:hypothetical protein